MSAHDGDKDPDEPPPTDVVAFAKQAMADGKDPATAIEDLKAAFLEFQEEAENPEDLLPPYLRSDAPREPPPETSGDGEPGDDRDPNAHK